MAADPSAALVDFRFALPMLARSTGLEKETVETACALAEMEADCIVEAATALAAKGVPYDYTEDEAFAAQCAELVKRAVASAAAEVREPAAGCPPWWWTPCGGTAATRRCAQTPAAAKQLCPPPPLLSHALSQQAEAASRGLETQPVRLALCERNPGSSFASFVGYVTHTDGMRYKVHYEPLDPAARPARMSAAWYGEDEAVEDGDEDEQAPAGEVDGAR